MNQRNRHHSKQLRNITLLVALSSAFATYAHADSCIGASAVPGKSNDGRFNVAAIFDGVKKQWKFTWTDTKQKQSATKKLPEIPQHSHLYLYVAENGSRFAVLAASAGHRTDQRVVGQCLGDMFSIGG